MKGAMTPTSPHPPRWTNHGSLLLDYNKNKNIFGDGEMTQLVQVASTAKPDDLSLMPRFHMVEGNNSHKLCATPHACTHRSCAPDTIYVYVIYIYIFIYIMCNVYNIYIIYVSIHTHTACVC